MTAQIITTEKNPLTEFQSLTNRVALIADSGWSLMIVDGRDAVDYLHRRLSKSVKTIPDCGGARALQLDGDGRMQADLLIYRKGSAVYALVRHDHAEATAELMEKYIIMDQVVVRREWKSEMIVNIIGPHADRLMEQATGHSDLSAAPWKMMDAAEIQGHVCRVFRDGRWRIPHYHVSMVKEKMEQVKNALGDLCIAQGGGLASHDALEFLRLEQGIAQWGTDLTAAVIPLEAGLTDAIDFSKGCFPGQEVVARIRNLGHPARQLVRFELPGEHLVEHGATVKIGNEEIGLVTSARTLPGADRTFALGYVKWKFKDELKAEVMTEAGSTVATISPLEKTSQCGAS